MGMCEATKPDDEEEEYYTDQAPQPPLPDQDQACQDEDWNKEGVPAQERHDAIQKRVAQPLVNEPEEIDVQTVQPLHRGKNLSMK